MLLLVLSIPLVALGQDSTSTVRLDGRALFRVGDSATVAAPARRDQIQRRLQALVDHPQAIAPAQVSRTGPAGSERQITVSARPVVTITPADAADAGLPVDALAGEWKQLIDGALQRAVERRTSARNRFGAEIQASVGGAFARLLESTITVIPRALAALLVIGVFWAIASCVRWLMRLLFRRFVSDLTVENLIRQVAYYSVWILGMVVAANAFGLEPQTLVTGLGLTSLALGFALKDILSNFVSGLLLLALRPFRLGDEIVVGDTEGTVERIQLRATQVRTYDGRHILVPNAEVFTSRVTNNTAAPVRRGSVALSVGYDVDLEPAIRAMCEAARATEGVLAEPPVTVRITELGPEDMLLEVRYWADSRRSDFLATASHVRAGVVRAFKRMSLGLPEPNVRIVVPGPSAPLRRARDGAQRPD